MELKPNLSGRNIVVVDLDDTVHEYSHTLALVALNEFGVRINTNPQEWKYGLHPVTDPDLCIKIFQACYDKKYLFLTNPYPGAVEALKEITKLGYTVIYLTDRPKFTYQDTLSWLIYHHFPNPHGLKCCDDKRDTMLEYKNMIASVIEDRPRALQFSQIALNCKHVFGIKQSHNINLTDCVGVYLYDTWAEILEKFKECNGDWELDWYDEYCD